MDIYDAVVARPGDAGAVEASTDTEGAVPPAPGAEDATGEPAAQEGGAPPPQERDEKGQFKPKRSAQERINEVIAKQRELERQLEIERSVNKTLLAQVPPVPQAPVPQAQQGTPPALQNLPPAPTLEQFGYDQIAHAKALGAWEAEAARAQQVELERQRNEVAAQARRTEEWNIRMREFSTQVPDAAARIADPSLSITPAMADVIRSSPRGPEVAYYLSQNPEVAVEISRAPVWDQGRRLGMIEAKMELNPNQFRSSAPPPLRPVGGGSGAPGSESHDAELARKDPEAWIRARNKAEMERRRESLRR